MILEENILTCEALNGYYGPLLEQNKEDKTFLEKLTGFYQTSGCDRSEIFADASELLYSMDPGPEAAHNLGLVFVAREELEKAADYLKEAVIGTGIENETRAEWFYELGVVSMALERYCDAIEYAREAILLKSDHGKALILLGDAFIGSRNNLGDDFEQRTAFWAAADKYAKAAAVDPSVADGANGKLASAARQYPNNEDVFFQDLKAGDTVQVGGCINESTTAKSRQ
jgi:tetratricopeptide (TPR) repeat protein